MTIYIDNNPSVVLALHAYRCKYKGYKAPSENTIHHIVSNFNGHGIVDDSPYVIKEIPRSSNELLEAVRESISGNANIRSALW